MGKAYAFKKQAQRSIIGDKHELETAPGFWFKPRKYSVHGDSVIKEASLTSADLPSEVLTEIAELVDEHGDLSIKDMMQYLSPEAKGKLIASRSHAATDDAKVLSYILLYGIGEHNFFAEEDSSIVVDEDLVQNILEFKDMAVEMSRVIQGFNNPLSKESDSISKMQLNGSSEKQMLEKTMDSKMIQENG